MKHSVCGYFVKGAAFIMAFFLTLPLQADAAFAEGVSMNALEENAEEAYVFIEEELGKTGPVLPEGYEYKLQSLRTEASELSDPDVVAAINRALGEVIHPGMTDLQKALALHDWLAVRCTYDDSLTYDTARDALVRGTATCQGYYEAYKLLMDAVGIENGYARSSNHIWNQIKIDGQWYNVDVTWDGTGVGEVLHSNFMKSDSGFSNHGRVIAKSYDCTSTLYDKGAFWSSSYNYYGTDGDKLDAGYFYSSAEGAYHLYGRAKTAKNPGKVWLVRRSDADGTVTRLQEITVSEYWKYDNAGTYATPRGTLLMIGTDLYFNDAKHVYRVTDNGKNLSVFYTITDDRDIIGIMERQGELLLKLTPYWTSGQVSYETAALPAYTWQWPEVVKLEPDYTLEGFVKRLYTVCLGRSYDSTGLYDWINQLNSRTKSAAEVAQGFFFSEEFKNHNYNDRQFVELLYKTMFGRNADEAGLNDWLSQMENGMSREYVFRGFAHSQEFSNLCGQYGVVRGEIYLGAYRDRNPGATGFIARLYTQMLGRSFDADGLEYWCRMYLTGTKSIEAVAADGFLHSQELTNQNLSDREFVTRMYRTFLNREPDADGLAYWMQQLKTGEKNRDTLVYGFTLSVEFAQLKSSYGL